eukprot:CAMPEP_0115553274 /NCGR_PEP_ID=MMETSP0271-20121206/96685_1 /TAXON_ID=71861 /ORGANISM="Scrippsiella trochoidea, Strain CCMP3099" /LENGTH=90 /DNA_ID=CAMNT_0002986947 /DNA_START=247 /DNA_END=516 /DNA_ORIENTATION=-
MPRVGAEPSQSPEPATLCRLLCATMARCLMAVDAVAPLPDFSVDPGSSTVTVNAGWNVDRLMCALGRHWPGYICEAQTGGRFFSVGGLVN